MFLRRWVVRDFLGTRQSSIFRIQKHFTASHCDR